MASDHGYVLSNRQTQALGASTPSGLANRLRHGFGTLLAGRDADLAYGRTLTTGRAGGRGGLPT